MCGNKGYILFQPLWSQIGNDFGHFGLKRGFAADFYFHNYRALKLNTSCGKFLNLAHYFPYDVKLRLLAHSRSFLANRKARNAIVGAENLLKLVNI